MVPDISSDLDSFPDGVHEHVGNGDVPDDSATADVGLEVDSDSGVEEGDVFGYDVGDSAGGFASDRDSGEGGGAGEPPDCDVGAGMGVGDAVFVPSAFYCDAVVAGDDEHVLDFYVFT